MIDNIKFNKDGLVAAIAQQYDTKEVLMMAYMSAESIALSLQEKRGIYYSRSRNEIWRKGESSGHIQHLKGIYYDCDADCLLLEVDQIGAACHTGERTCFFRKLQG